MKNVLKVNFPQTVLFNSGAEKLFEITPSALTSNQQATIANFFYYRLYAVKYSFYPRENVRGNTTGEDTVGTYQQSFSGEEQQLLGSMWNFNRDITVSPQMLRESPTTKAHMMTRPFTRFARIRPHGS